MSKQNQIAKLFASLHVPGKPLVLANVYDRASTRAMISLRPELKAIATASYGVANVAGFEDFTMTYETHIQSLQHISDIIKTSASDLPFSIDILDGYGPRLEEAITKIIELGAVGCNIEDAYLDRSTGNVKLYELETMKDRLLKAKKVASDLGVPDFVFNVRTDSVWVPEGNTGASEAFIQERKKLDLPIDAAIARGKAYLATGVPTTIFVWAGPSVGGTTSASVKRYVEAFNGRFSVLLRNKEGGGLSVEELGKLGVARVSIGPDLLFKSTEAIKGLARGILAGGYLGSLALKV